MLSAIVDRKPYSQAAYTTGFALNTASIGLVAPPLRFTTLGRLGPWALPWQIKFSVPTMAQSLFWNATHYFWNYCNPSMHVWDAHNMLLSYRARKDCEDWKKKNRPIKFGWVKLADLFQPTNAAWASLGSTNLYGLGPLNHQAIEAMTFNYNNIQEDARLLPIESDRNSQRILITYSITLGHV